MREDIRFKPTKEQEAFFRSPDRYRLFMGTRRPSKGLKLRKLIEAVEARFGDDVEIKKEKGCYVFRLKKRELKPIFDEFVETTELALTLLYG